MSNVVHIELDRKNRVYRAGEVISGAIVVDGRVGERARRVVLRTWWATRGKGTATSGGKAAAILHEGPAPKGALHRHSFHFVAPDAPFTYIGEHLAVEHHLQAVIELPMAPDLKVEESFVLTPGDQVAPPPDDLLGVVSSSSARAEKRPAAAIGLLLTIFGIFTLPFPGLLFVAGGLITLAVGLRKEIASSRIGEVSVEVTPRVVSPGDEVRVEVGIFPKQPVAIQGIAATLRAQEVCESQSGNNKKRHRHLGHEDTQTLIGSMVVPGELRRDMATTFVVPALGMWSFKASRNQVRWDVEVIVEIPRWPDWVQTVPIVVWPAKGAIAAPTEVAIPAPEGEAIAARRPLRLPPRGSVAQTPSQGRIVPPVPEPAPTPAPPLPESAGAELPAPESAGAEPPIAAPPRVEPFDFAAAVSGILETRRYTPQRDTMVESLVGRSVEVHLVVDRVDRPFGRTRRPGFEEGRVVRGRLRGTDLEIEVHVPTAKSDLVEEAERGDSLTLSGAVASWERLPERPVIRIPP